MKQFFFILTIGFGLILTKNCKSHSIPQNVPSNAKYDRKTNVYIAIQGNKLLKYNKEGFLFESCEIQPSGVLDGYCEGYLMGTNQVIKKGRFKNGQRDGLWVWYFENGVPYIEQNFTYGKKREFWIPVQEWGNEDGIYRRYYPDGRLEEVGFFESGYRNGSWIKYYPSGIIESKGSYHHGKKSNHWYYYYPNGFLEAEEWYSKDGDFFSRKTYYPNGSLLCEMKKNEKPKCRESQLE